jgi:hypothetical protein
MKRLLATVLFLMVIASPVFASAVTIATIITIIRIFRPEPRCAGSANSAEPASCSSGTGKGIEPQIAIEGMIGFLA